MTGALARLSWLGIARETAPGMATLPTAAVPVDVAGYEPQDTPQWLPDTGVRASMGAVAGITPGTLGSAHAFSGPLYPDTCGWWLDNLLGDTSTTSAGTLAGAQPLAAAANAGDTQFATTASIGTVTPGSVVQISDGAASEVVTATAGSTGTSVQCAGTPLRFPHATTATAALQTAANGYTHTFAVLNSGSGQPPTHTLTDTTGLTAGTRARCYPGVCVTEVSLAGDPGGGFATAKVTALGWLSQPAATTPATTGFPAVPGFAGWQSTVTIGGAVAYAGQWAATITRQAVIYRSAGGGQNPFIIARGGVTVTGRLAYPDPADETPLSQVLSSGPVNARITLTAGAASLTVNCPSAQFTTAKPDREKIALGYGTTFQATDTAAAAGGSGGTGPATVTLANATAVY